MHINYYALRIFYILNTSVIQHDGICHQYIIALKCKRINLPTVHHSSKFTNTYGVRTLLASVSNFFKHNSEVTYSYLSSTINCTTYTGNVVSVHGNDGILSRARVANQITEK